MDLKELHKDLLSLRKEHKADSKIGTRCSNLIEITKNYETSEILNQTEAALRPME